MKNVSEKFLPFLLLVLLILGCNLTDKIKQKIEESNTPRILSSADGSCQVTVPGLWEELKSEKEEIVIEASFELYDEVGVMVVKENKSDFTGEPTLDYYAELVRKGLPNRMTNAVVTLPIPAQVNGYEAREFEVTGSVQELNITYLYALVSTPEHLYQVISWSTIAGYKNNKTTMRNVVYSFKENTGNAPASNGANRPPRPIRKIPGVKR